MPKTLISIRLEDSVLSWFKSKAPSGYQKKIQAVLRDFHMRSLLKDQALVGRAQQIFLQYHARCFWHLKPDLVITASHIPMIQTGLRKYGGMEGLRLAAELNLDQIWELDHAYHPVSKSSSSAFE